MVKVGEFYRARADYRASPRITAKKISRITSGSFLPREWSE
jgi:hypothetical protein